MRVSANEGPQPEPPGQGIAVGAALYLVNLLLLPGLGFLALPALWFARRRDTPAMAGKPYVYPLIGKPCDD